MEDEKVIGKDFYDKNLPIEKVIEEPKEVIVKTPNEQSRIDKEYDSTIASELLEDIKEENLDMDSESISVDKLSKTNYLYQIFGQKHDKYKSYYYLRKEHKRMLASAYPEGALLNLYLFNSVVLRRLQIEFQQSHKAKAQSKSPQPEDLVLLKSIESLSEKQSRVQHALDAAKASQRAGQDVHDLHKKEMEDCAEFIQENIGEFSFKCSKCSTIISSGGLPHWALISEVHGKSYNYYIWSREIFRLVKKRLIPIYYMAFILRTSIEGLQWTADAREETLPEYDILEEEAKLKELRLKHEEKEIKRQR